MRARESQARLRPAVFLAGLAAVMSVLTAEGVSAHHVLGRPAYSLNEDSNTPPSMQIEARIGSYFISMMAYPAFIQPGEPGRIHLYATHDTTGKPYTGNVTFSVRDDVLFGTGQSEALGIQPPNDAIYRQGVVFKEKGEYIVSAFFEAGGEPYTIDFPMTVGDPLPVRSLVMGGVVLAAALGLAFAARVLRGRRRRRVA